MGEQLVVRAVQHGAALDPALNRAAVSRLITAGADLHVMPEASARDFGDPSATLADAAEPIPGPWTDALDEVARAAHTTVIAGMFEAHPDVPTRPWNTVVVRGPAGGLGSYRKIHLYDSFGYRESDRLSAGPPDPLILTIEGWQVGVMTCYDLRFPELARRLVTEGAEVLVVPAAWLPGPRKLDHWRTLAIARAIENTAYVVAVGQPGPRYTGHSLIVDPWGDVLAEAGEDATILEAPLSKAVLAAARETNPSLANRRL